MNICFDVNAIIHLYTNTREQAETLQAYDVALIRNFEVCAPACSLADIHYILHRNGLSGDALRESMSALFEMFRVFDANEQDGKNALLNDMNDYEDALIAESASRNGMDVILTYNTKDFRYSPVKAMTPMEFVDTFKPHNYIYEETAW
ncbi:MAG: PIN domain-containing protein [Coriobacteriia bacterium]|nr:PIN domain-containing protein [Coriobacteriia bacterium]